jgi:hypothetical protein
MNSLAKKCDRCGNFYLLDDWDFWMNVTTSNGNRESVYVTNPDGIAICQDCQKSFVEWWSNIQNKENKK